MADNLASKSGQDRKRINVDERYEVAYWSKKFGVTAGKLREAVAAVGVMAPRVETFLSGAAVTKKATRPGTKVATRPTRGTDAIALLRADHKRISDLFDLFEKSRSTAKKKTLVAQICLELTVHAQIEEEIFYPAVKAALKDKELVPEARVEHASVKDLIAQVEGIEPDGEMYDAKVHVMSEFVKHHVKEEQNEMFPKAKGTRLDLIELGERLKARKEELMAEKADPAAGALGKLGAAAAQATKKLGDLVSGA